MTAKICQKSGKNQEKSGKIVKKEEKSGRKGKNREVSFTLPLLTDRAGYATDKRTTYTNNPWHNESARLYNLPLVFSIQCDTGMISN